MKCASCVNISICSEMKEKLPDDCEYYQIRYDKNKKPEKIKYKKPETLKKTPEKKMTINEIVSRCKTLGITYGQFQALRKEQEQAE